MAYIIPDIERVISRNKGVQKAVYDEAREIKSRAQTILAAHRDEGHARIEISRSSPDAYVSLVDVAALSIEYGRSEFTRDDGVTVGAMQGLYVLHRAGGL